MSKLRPYQEELLRHLEYLGIDYGINEETVFYEFTPGAEDSWVHHKFDEQGTYTGRSWDQGPMKEINPKFKPTPKPTQQVKIFRNESERRTEVSLPSPGCLGDRRLYDGLTGLPANIGPTAEGPSKWKRTDKALQYFAKVAENFAKL